MQRAIIMRMLNIWVATPTQQSGWGRAHYKGKSGPALRRAPGSAPALAGPAGPSKPPLILLYTACGFKLMMKYTKVSMYFGREGDGGVEASSPPPLFIP